MKRMDLSGKHVVVVGLARSGLATARFLIQKGANVTITDKASPHEISERAQKARSLGAVLELGRHLPETFDSADLIVVSPGVPHNIDLLQHAQAKGIEVIGEIELACRFIEKPIVAITGTNGKTTTTELLGHILTCADIEKFVGGNIGTPLISYLTEPNINAKVAIVEVSSFQLDTIKTFHPQIAILLNISPDHSDRYTDMNAYVFSKGRVFENQTTGDIAICNSNDPRIMALAPAIQSEKRYFGHMAQHTSAKGENNALIDGSRILIQNNGQSPGRFDLSSSSLQGAHNMENAAAAILAAKALNVEDQIIQTALETFTMQPHRLEQVSTINGVTYINDSKATNVDAVARALTCFSKQIVLIMGGRNKDNDFSPLKDLVQQHVANLVAYGEAAEEIIAALEGACIGRSLIKHQFKDAVLLAHNLAQPGQIVLLSPACASFDQFDGYPHRGETFRQIIESLA
ncbi:MAG: UDP-N-acetylmuramoyl-L-alanine--D-glutamate ligase [Desulfobacteraceae bacterium]